MSSIFREVIKTGFTISPADLASFVTDRLAIQPEIESLGVRKQKTPNRDFINGAIDKTLGELNFTGPRADNIKKRLWSRLGHATHTEEMQLLMEKIAAIKWAAEGRDVESPEFADYNSTKFAEAEAALNMQLIAYLKDPQLMKAKKEPVVLGVGEYRFLDFKTDNTLDIKDLELILNNFEKIITDRLQVAQMADANLEQTKLTRGVYTDDEKNAAINYSKILYPKVFGKLDKASLSEYTGIDTGLAEALGIPLDQLTLTMTFFTFKMMTIANYLSKFSDQQKKTEVETLASSFSSYGPALESIATEFLTFAATNAPVMGQRFTMRDLNKKAPGKKANTFTAWMKQAIDKLDQALPAPGEYGGMTADSGSSVVDQILEAQSIMMNEFQQRLNEIRDLARQSAALRIKIDQLMGGGK
jgi:hypothetical protein